MQTHMENNLRVGKKAWVVAVDMGYGHQRTAYPLRDLAFGGQIINANNYNGIDPGDKRFWQISRYSYEFISRFRRVPFLGEMFFALLNSFQKTFPPKTAPS